MLTVLLFAAAGIAWGVVIHLTPGNRHVEPGPVQRFLTPASVVLTLLGFLSFIHDLFGK